MEEICLDFAVIFWYNNCNHSYYTKIAIFPIPGIAGDRKAWLRRTAYSCFAVY